MKALIGLYTAQQTLQNLLGSGNGVHAVLFYGPEGAGKTELAKRLAKGWMCRSRVQGGCDACQICQSLDQASAVDLLWVAPQPPSLLIRLDAISLPSHPSSSSGFSIQEFFRTPPLVAQNKVIVIEQADRMTRDASNALLKTLEEPYAHGKLILITSARSQVPLTILSRCMPVLCELPESVELEDALGPVSQVEVLYGGGAPGMILQIREHALVYQKLHDFFESLETRSKESALRQSEEFRKMIADFEQFKKGGARGALAEMLRCFANWMRTKKPSRSDLIQKVIECHRRVLANAHPAYLCDALFCKFFYEGVADSQRT